MKIYVNINQINEVKVIARQLIPENYICFERGEYVHLLDLKTSKHKKIKTDDFNLVYSPMKINLTIDN